MGCVAAGWAGGGGGDGDGGGGAPKPLGLISCAGWSGSGVSGDVGGVVNVRGDGVRSNVLLRVADGVVSDCSVSESESNVGLGLVGLVFRLKSRS